MANIDMNAAYQNLVPCVESSIIEKQPISKSSTGFTGQNRLKLPIDHDMLQLNGEFENYPN